MILYMERKMLSLIYHVTHLRQVRCPSISFDVASSHNCQSFLYRLNISYRDENVPFLRWYQDDQTLSSSLYTTWSYFRSFMNMKMPTLKPWAAFIKLLTLLICWFKGGESDFDLSELHSDLQHDEQRVAELIVAWRMCSTRWRSRSTRSRRTHEFSHAISVNVFLMLSSCNWHHTPVEACQIWIHV
jgi:hypothetical protein